MAEQLSSYLLPGGSAEGSEVLRKGYLLRTMDLDSTMPCNPRGGRGMSRCDTVRMVSATIHVIGGGGDVEASL